MENESRIAFFSKQKKTHNLLKPFIIKGHAEVDAEVHVLRTGKKKLKSSLKLVLIMYIEFAQTRLTTMYFIINMSN